MWYTGITRPCTKHNWLVKDVKDLAKVIHRAFEVERHRPGPVLIDIPKDIVSKTTYNKYKNKKLNGKVKNHLNSQRLISLWINE